LLFPPTIALAKDRGEIPPPVQDTGDFDMHVRQSIENDVGMNQDRSQAGHDFIARPPHQRLFGQSFARLINVSQQLVGNFR